MAENVLGRNQVFAIKNADGTPFHDLVLYKATYDSVVMSLGDKITGDVYYKDNGLNVTMNEYIEFKRDPDDSSEEPVKFVLVSPPTIIKEGIVSENSELKGTTKYSFEFYHPMYKLGNMPLTDIAVTSSEENYLSQNKTFSWCGTGNDFIAKLNANLSYSEWVVVASTNAQSAERLAMMPSDVPTKKAGEQAKSNVLSFDKNTIADGLRTIYETWDIPFVVDTLHQGEYYDINGNDYYSIAGGSKRFVVVVGMPSNEIIDTESEFGTVVEATLLTSNNIYYSPQPINVRKGKKIVLESLTEGATPIILNSSHNGVIGTTRKTFEADMTIYVGLYTKSGLVRYVYDGGEGSIFVFRYGQEVGLKNNSRTPRNNKIITRISASGSEDNIPYGYPQIQWTGSEDDPRLKYPLYKGIVGGQYVTLIKHPFTRTRLMPTVYVESVNKKVNPSHPLYDPDIELVDYYDADNTYENPIVASSPSYEIHEFDGIKPELDSNRQIAIQGAIPLNDDLTPADSWVDDLKPDTDEYAQSYFRITLPPLGFDVYACASITQQMQINMRGGACIGCTFEIQVDWDDYKANFYDSEGNFDPAIGTGHPRDAQKYPNSTSSSINVVVKKEISTFGTLMPNIYQQPTSGDLFVILGISLPASYIIDAQQRLDNTAKQYMRENNLHYFDYPLKFDEFFLAKHPSILRQIRTNTIVRFEYAGETLHLCVKQITIKFGEKALPQYNITLTDNIEVVLNPINQIANDVSRISTMAYQNAKQAGQGSGGSGNAQDKLSKVSDDTASGLITFLKGVKIGLQRLFGWDAEGNITANDITANDVNVGGLLTSMRAKIDELFSSNYSGSGIFESGWLLTNNHNGHSYLEIDELLVRMKAVFMELEIRKETYSGGNVFYSPAGSIIYRVEPQNASNEPLGQRTIETVRPWSWSRRLLGLFGLSKIGLFSHKHIIKIQDDVDPSLVHHYRCYLIADDGTVQTRNWWHDNDQARCQTFNRASEKHSTDQSDQTNPNFDDNYVQRNMDGNRFFWRLVTNVGSTKLEDGKWYDYVDLDNFTPDDGYVRGSDVPVAGDSIVCIGNRVDEERMNMIMLEVIGDDAPAIKIYKGINSFSFDGRKYMNVSPKKIQLRSGSIEYISDNGQILPPKMSRGAWVSGVRYHYYDEVSHSGSTWLCIIIDGYRWEDAQGNIIESEGLIGEMRAGEGLFVYGTDSHGEDLKDRYYSIGTYNGSTVYKVRKYTINEPSDLHAAEWQKEVSAGGSGVRGSFKSRVFARTNTDIASEQYRPTGGDYDHPWPGGVSGSTQHGVTWYDGIPNTDSSYQLWSSVCTFHGDGRSSDWSIPAPESDSQTQDIEFSLLESPTAPSGNTPYADHSSEGWYDPSRRPTLPDGKTWSDMVWRAERKVRNGVYSGDWVLTKILGESGDPAPQYMEIQEAWSNDDSTAGDTIAPETAHGRTDGTPSHPAEADWSGSTPSNPNNYAYLWRRSRTRVWNAATGTYSTPAWKYVRLSGTNGTSIETKGTVESTNYLLDGYVRPYINGATVPESQKVAVSDGWAYVNRDDGHLYQWSDELRAKSGSWSGWSSGWIDLGRFQGETGETYFTHIAWGKGVIIGTPTYTPTKGQKSTPNASACTNFSIAPVDGYDYMGTLIDQVSDDCTNWQNYTWKYMQGSNAVRIDLDNEMDAVSVDSNRNVRFNRTITVVACIYDGAVKASGIGHSMQPSAMAIGTRVPTITGPTNNEVTITWAFQKGDAVTAQQQTIALTYKGHTYTHDFSLTTTEFSAIYQCAPSPSALSFTWDTANQRYAPTSVRVDYGYKKDEGNGVVYIAQPSSYTIDNKYRVARRTFNNGVWTSWAFATYDTLNTPPNAFSETSIEMCITTSTTSGSDITDANIIDREVIPIVRSGKDGVRGDFKSTVFKRTNTTPVATPTGGSYDAPWPGGVEGTDGWYDGIPDGEAILWASTRTFYDDARNSVWSTPKQMTDTADLDVEFSSVESPNPPSGHPNTNTQWSNTSDSTTIWMATSEKHNGVWSAWQVSKIKGEKGDPIDPDDPTVIAIIDEAVRDAASALKDGLTIIMKPQVLIYNQDTEEAATFATSSTGQRTTVEIYKGSDAVNFTIVNTTQNPVKAYGIASNGSVALMTGCAGCDNTKKTVWLSGITMSPNAQTGEFEYAYDHGYIEFVVTVEPGTSTAKSYILQVSWYLNRLGNRDVKVRGDISTTYMSRTEYSLSDLKKDQTVNLLRGTQNPQIGETVLGNNLWSNDNSQYLSIETLTETPIAGYNKAFHIGTTSAKFYQIGSFWEKTDTYRFSAYVRGVGGNATAVVEVAEPIQVGAVQTNTVAVGTEWQYVVFAITISNFNNGIDCMFRLGSNSGTVEFLAPTVVDITSPSVIRTDYEGQIQTSAAGIREDLKKVTDVVGTNGEKAALKTDLASYVRTADYNASTLMTMLDGEVVTESTFEQTSSSLQSQITNNSGQITTISQKSDAISLGVYSGGIVLYNRASSVTAYNGASTELYSTTYDNLLNGITVPDNRYYIHFSAEVKISSNASSGYLSITFYYNLGGGSSDDTEILYDISQGVDKWVKIERFVALTSKITSFDRSGSYTIEAYNSTGYSASIKNISAKIVSSDMRDLYGAGIDIAAGRVDVLADNFTIRNNNDEQTLGVNANGDFEVSGTIKANNLYRSLCILSGYYNTISGRTVVYYSTEWYYCKSREDDRTIEGGYEIGKYYEDNSSRGLWSNSDFSRNTYSADIVLITNNGAADWPSGGIVMIPRAQDFPGKVIEFRNYGNNSATIQIVSGYFVTFHLDNQGNIVVSGYTSNSQTLVAGATMTLYSFKNGNTYYWMRIS